jgi:acyl carrier protein
MTDTTTTASVRETILAVLSEVLFEPAEALRAQPVLAVHAWDSVTSLVALVRIEERLKVSLDLRSYHGARSVDDLADLVVAAGAAAGVRPWLP